MDAKYSNNNDVKWLDNQIIVWTSKCNRIKVPEVLIVGSIQWAVMRLFSAR